MAEQLQRTFDSIAKLPSRQFRTMLRVLSRGQSFADAQTLLRHRAATAGTELLADDINTVLSSAVFCDPPRMINTFLARVKKSGALVGLAQDAAVAQFAQHLHAWDLGPYPDLAEAAYARSPAIHADRAKLAEAGLKRGREEGEAPPGRAEGEEGSGAAGEGSAAGGGSGGGAAAVEAEAEAFKRLSAVLNEAFSAPPAAAAWGSSEEDAATTPAAAEGSAAPPPLSAPAPAGGGGGGGGCTHTHPLPPPPCPPVAAGTLPLR